LTDQYKCYKDGKLHYIFSIACLGALTPSAKTFELAQSYKKFHSAVVEDKEAVSACLRFAGIILLIIVHPFPNKFFRYILPLGQGRYFKLLTPYR
jgi:hypothetical protein